MRVLEFTVRFQVGTKEEQAAIMELLGAKGCDKHIPADKGVKEEGTLAYTPASDRTKAAAEALSKCKRVGVLRLEVLEVWANAYPDVNLAAEIAKCESWAESTNKTRTARGWQKTLNGWLSKEQDKARSGPVALAPKPISAPVAIEAETKAWIEAEA